MFCIIIMVISPSYFLFPLQLYNGYFKVKIEAHLLFADVVFRCAGFKVDSTSFVLYMDEPINFTLLFRVAFECFVAHAECKLVMELYCKISSEHSLISAWNCRLRYQGNVPDNTRRFSFSNVKTDESVNSPILADDGGSEHKDFRYNDDKKIYVNQSKIPLNTGTRLQDDKRFIYIKEPSESHTYANIPRQTSAGVTPMIFMNEPIYYIDDASHNGEEHEANFVKGTLEDHVEASMSNVLTVNTKYDLKGETVPPELPGNSGFEEWSFVRDSLQGQRTLQGLPNQKALHGLGDNVQDTRLGLDSQGMSRQSIVTGDSNVATLRSRSAGINVSSPTSELANSIYTGLQDSAYGSVYTIKDRVPGLPRSPPALPARNSGPIRIMANHHITSDHHSGLTNPTRNLQSNVTSGYGTYSTEPLDESSLNKSRIKLQADVLSMKDGHRSEPDIVIKPRLSANVNRKHAPLQNVIGKTSIQCFQCTYDNNKDSRLCEICNSPLEVRNTQTFL